MLKDREQLLAEGSIPPEILSGILTGIRPEKVFCFGVRTNVAEAWSCFLPDNEREGATCYDLLILTAPNEKRPHHELLNMAEALNTKTLQVNALVHNAVSVREAIYAGNAFFAAVCTKGQLLYDDESISFKMAAGDYCSTGSLCVNHADWTKRFGLARKFLAGASHFFCRGWNDMSAFMLHQATEHTCIALTRAITGYRPNTHNLTRLIRLMHNFDPFGLPIFPRDTKEEIILFNILSRAYSEARYKESYWVTSREIAILIDRVTDFQNRAEGLYRERARETLVTVKS